MTTAVVTQPTYLPWLGYFEQLHRADVFVFLDTVQFARRSWQSRNRLKAPDDTEFWLTVPVASQPRDTALRDVRLATGQPWVDAHLTSIRHALGPTPWFEQLFPEVQAWLRSPYELLADLTIAGIELQARLLGLAPRFVRASDLGIEGKRTELLVAACRAVGADAYYSASGSAEYLEDERHLFDAAGISIEYQSWVHPQYPQRGRTFVSHLAALDALMNVGAQAARALVAGS